MSANRATATMVSERDLECASASMRFRHEPAIETPFSAPVRANTAP
jgi:hypothetical protein